MDEARIVEAGGNLQETVELEKVELDGLVCSELCWHPAPPDAD